MRYLLLALALLFTVPQQPPRPDPRLPDGPEEALPDIEKAVPPGHYCMNHTERKMAPNAHECHCDYVCQVDYDDKGEPIDYRIQEMPDCKTYCHKNGRRCTCWPEAPCPKPA